MSERISPEELFPPGSRYRILGEAGRGAMGVVCEAHDTKLDCRIAIYDDFTTADKGRHLGMREYTSEAISRVLKKLELWKTLG